MFLSDSDHSAACEGRECKLVAPKLTLGAFVPGDKGQITSEGSTFFARHGRRFLFFEGIQKITNIAVEPAFPTKRF